MRSCSNCDHFPQDNHCMGCIYDHDIGGNTKWESKNDPDVMERKVIDDIRQEIYQKACSNYGSGFGHGLNVALKIIDKHIGERSNDAEWKESEPLDDVVELIGGD